MILKEKILVNHSSPTAKAGQEQEKTVSFYLRRAFKNEPQVLVFNDIKLSHDGETAQIDHLILYPYGFILIESKSITGHVKINESGEWSRTYNSAWRGMPSPIKQVELQRDLLKNLVQANVETLLGKLFGINALQKGVGARCWDCFCAISSNAIIDRDSAPKDLSGLLVKSEFIADVVKKKMNLSRSRPTAIQLLKNDSRPWFNEEEMNNLADFLLSRDLCIQSTTVNKPDVQIAPSAKKINTVTEGQILKCKKCGGQDNLQPAWGKFGYYVKCGHCDTNTSMKRACPSCNDKKTKVSKAKDIYTLMCQQCEHQETIFKLTSTSNI